MKKIKVLGLILSAVALAAFFMACSNPAGSDGGRRDQGDIRFTVTFNSNGGTDTPTAQLGLARGARVVEPADPAREPAGWFNFMGWYSDINLTNRWNFAASTVTADTTLFARWALTDNAGEVGDLGPGTPGPGGPGGGLGGTGTIFYRRDAGFIMADTNERAFFLVVAPVHADTSVSFSDPFPSAPPHRLIPRLSQYETDTTDRTIGRGRLNTAIILYYGINGVPGCGMPFATPAATAANSFSSGGHNDWFLPSKYELIELYDQAGGTSPNITLNTNFQHFQSSSQANVNHVWRGMFHIPSANWIAGSKCYGASNHARPIRAF